MEFTNANFVNSEYMTPRDYIEEADYDQGSESISSSSSSRQRIRMHRFLTVGTLVNDSTKLYKYWDYMSSVHVASISAVMYSFVIVMIDWNYKTWISMRIISALLDVYFLVRIYVNAHVTYKEPDSGIVIKDLPLIRKRYFSSLAGFWLDLFTVFPFEYVVLLATDDINITKYGYTVRVFRCLFLYKYYKQQEENLNVRHHLRLTYLLYKVLFCIEWTACIW